MSKTRHNVKKFVMTPRIRYYARNIVMTSKTRHGIKKTRHEVTKIRHDVINTWRQKVRHYVKNTSWRQKVRHDVKKHVMMSKTRHDAKKFILTYYVMTNFLASWCVFDVMTNFVYVMTWFWHHGEFLTSGRSLTSWHQNHVITYTTFVMTSKTHNDKIFVMT